MKATLSIFPRQAEGTVGPRPLITLPLRLTPGQDGTIRFTAKELPPATADCWVRLTAGAKGEYLAESPSQVKAWDLVGCFYDPLTEQEMREFDQANSELPEGYNPDWDPFVDDEVEIVPERIAAVLITHFHDDHCGALAKLRQLAHPKVVSHRVSVEPATLLPPLPRELVDYTVEDGDTVEVGSLSFAVHHLPGHTHDSVAYQLGRDLFIGDITFEWAGVGWMDIHWGSCIWQYKESLTKLLALGPATLYPGHGGPCALSEASIYRAQNTLDILEKIDGSPLMIGQPAPTRRADEPRQVVRIEVAR
jgi:glyoxylase-like metal-dependent hydrolase (beta-lactamase superfamily II)